MKKKNRLLSEKIKRFFFKSYYAKIDFMEEWNEKFPCRECRPDPDYTFYHDIELRCHVCGRVYYL